MLAAAVISAHVSGRDLIRLTDLKRFCSAELDLSIADRKLKELHRLVWETLASAVQRGNGTGILDRKRVLQWTTLEVGQWIMSLHPSYKVIGLLVVVQGITGDKLVSTRWDLTHLTGFDIDILKRELQQLVQLSGMVLFFCRG